MLGFSNRTFEEFFRETADIDIYSYEYSCNGDSKAKRLKAFWDKEPDLLVGKILSELLRIWQNNNLQKLECDSCQLQRYNQAKNIINRLNNQQNGEEEFLQRSYNIPLKGL